MVSLAVPRARWGRWAMMLAAHPVRSLRRREKPPFSQTGGPLRAPREAPPRGLGAVAWPLVARAQKGYNFNDCDVVPNASSFST